MADDGITLEAKAHWEPGEYGGWFLTYEQVVFRVVPYGPTPVSLEDVGSQSPRCEAAPPGDSSMFCLRSFGHEGNHRSPWGTWDNPLSRGHETGPLFSDVNGGGPCQSAPHSRPELYCILPFGHPGKHSNPVDSWE